MSETVHAAHDPDELCPCGCGLSDAIGALGVVIYRHP